MLAPSQAVGGAGVSVLVLTEFKKQATRASPVLCPRDTRARDEGLALLGLDRLGTRPRVSLGLKLSRVPPRAHGASC